MRLSDYIERHGAAVVADRVGVTTAAVVNWKLKGPDGAPYRRPRPEHARKLVETSGGELSWFDIYPDAGEINGDSHDVAVDAR